jgi:hypothetical protein
MSPTPAIDGKRMPGVRIMCLPQFVNSFAPEGFAGDLQLFFSSEHQGLELKVLYIFISFLLNPKVLYILMFSFELFYTLN